MSGLEDAQRLQPMSLAATAASSHGDVVAILAANDRADFGTLAKLADSLAVKAPGLAGILRSSSVRIQVDKYRRLDREAVEQHARYMRELTVAHLCLLVTGILSGLVLASGRAAPLAGMPLIQNVSFGFGTTILVLGAWASMLTYQARNSDRLGRWLAARAGAEMARITAFQIIATDAAAKSQTIASCALAFLRLHLLDQQRKWLETAVRRHRNSSERTVVWGGIASALAFLAGSTAINAGLQPNQTWLAIAGVIAAAINSYAVNREALRRDHANADRYEKAVVALDALASRFDAVAKEVLSGKQEALVAYTTAITEQLTAEHKQWLDGAAQAESIIAKLDAELQKAGKANRDGNDRLFPRGAAETLKQANRR